MWAVMGLILCNNMVVMDIFEDSMVWRGFQNAFGVLTFEGGTVLVSSGCQTDHN